MDLLDSVLGRALGQADGIRVFPSISSEAAGPSSLRASDEHSFTVRVLRAGGRPGYPSNPAEAARCASIRIDQAGL